MRRYDLSPLYRTSVGFDHFAELLDKAFSQDVVSNSYPPFNVEKTSEDRYLISLAAAGTSEDDLSVEVRENQLIVSARKSEESEDDGRFLHRGIARRSFERRFRLADHVQVDGASYVNGMLNIELVRVVPEALKPRRIEITSSKKAKVGKSADPVQIAA